MTKWMGLVVALVAIGNVGACANEKKGKDNVGSAAPAAAPIAPPEQPSASSEPEAPMAKPIEADIDVTSRALFADYRENEIAADSKYRGKLLVVSGKITRISRDVEDAPLVELGTSNEFMSVYATFPDETALASLKRGQQVSVRCRSKGVSAGNPLLEGCSLLPPEPKEAIADPGRSQKVTINLQPGESRPSAEEQQRYIATALAVRDRCRAAVIKGDRLRDLWNTAHLIVGTPQQDGAHQREAIGVMAIFDDRRRSVHHGVRPLYWIDTRTNEILTRDEGARLLCNLKSLDWNP